MPPDMNIAGLPPDPELSIEDKLSAFEPEDAPSSARLSGF